MMLLSRLSAVLLLLILLLSGTNLFASIKLSSLAKGKPELMNLMDKSLFVTQKAKRIKGGRVAYFNWNLAKEWGVELPASGVMTQAFEREIIETFGWHIAPFTESVDGKNVIEVYADKYRYPKKAGSSRAAYVGKKVQIKGIGLTSIYAGMENAGPPLENFVNHGDGSATLVEGIESAIYSEFSNQHFPRGGNRIIAIIETGDNLHYPDGGAARKALIVREASTTVRPAHLFHVGSAKARKSMMKRVLRYLYPELSGKSFYVKIRHLVKDFAKQEAFKHHLRFTHGSLISSNISLSGALIDFGTASTQPKTAPIFTFAEHLGVFGREHHMVWGVLRRVIDQVGIQSRLVEALEKVFYDEYSATIRYNHMRSLGLPETFAKKAARGSAAVSASNTLYKLSQEANKTVFNANKTVPDSVSRYNVHNVLEKSAADFFDPMLTKEGRIARIEKYLQTVVTDAADLEKATAMAKSAAKSLERDFATILTDARRYAASRGIPITEFQSEIINQARFMNRPISELYRPELKFNLFEKIHEYEKTGNIGALRASVSDMIARTIREPYWQPASTERMIVHGKGSVFEFRPVAINGIRYSTIFKAKTGRFYTNVELKVEPRGNGYFVPTLNRIVESLDDLRNLHFRYTVDGWSTHHQARLANINGRMVFVLDAIDHTIPASLEGAIFDASSDVWYNNFGRNFSGYRILKVKPRTGAQLIKRAIKPASLQESVFKSTIRRFLRILH